MSTASAATSNTIGSAFLAELEQEAKVAREVLSRVPAEKFDWKPHEKSMSFGKLASHVAEMVSWTGPTLDHPELDFAKMEYKPFEPKTTEELLEFFDKNLAEAVQVLKNMTDDRFIEPWSLRNGEAVYFTMPKVVAMRSFVMNHIIHHRGQLSVYLRLNDIAVPSMYGPSADEGAM
ncbi:MAG TPA: DinB family protein [Pyrinomonadaceae bacterium]|nr:DinB family protein [Pyrinomonadaceae bacterium]